MSGAGTSGTRPVEPVEHAAGLPLEERVARQVRRQPQRPFQRRTRLFGSFPVQIEVSQITLVQYPVRIQVGGTPEVIFRDLPTGVTQFRPGQRTREGAFPSRQGHDLQVQPSQHFVGTCVGGVQGQRELRLAVNLPRARARSGRDSRAVPGAPSPPRARKGHLPRRAPRPRPAPRSGSPLPGGPCVGPDRGGSRGRDPKRRGLPARVRRSRRAIGRDAGRGASRRLDLSAPEQRVRLQGHAGTKVGPRHLRGRARRPWLRGLAPHLRRRSPGDTRGQGCRHHQAAGHGHYRSPSSGCLPLRPRARPPARRARPGSRRPWRSPGPPGPRLALLDLPLHPGGGVVVQRPAPRAPPPATPAPGPSSGARRAPPVRSAGARPARRPGRR